MMESLYQADNFLLLNRFVPALCSTCMSAKIHVCVSVHTKEESVPKSDLTGSIFALPKLIRSVQFKVFRLCQKCSGYKFFWKILYLDGIDNAL